MMQKKYSRRWHFSTFHYQGYAAGKDNYENALQPCEEYGVSSEMASKFKSERHSLLYYGDKHCRSEKAIHQPQSSLYCSIRCPSRFRFVTQTRACLGN